MVEKTPLVDIAKRLAEIEKEQRAYETKIREHREKALAIFHQPNRTRSTTKEMAMELRLVKQYEDEVKRLNNIATNYRKMLSHPLISSTEVIQRSLRDRAILIKKKPMKHNKIVLERVKIDSFSNKNHERIIKLSQKKSIFPKVPTHEPSDQNYKPPRKKR